MNLYKSLVKIGNDNFNVIAINKSEDEYVEITTSATEEAIHHIQLFDRSYSMSNVISKLIDNMQMTIDAMGENDLLTVIYFAGVGQYRTILKAAKKNANIKEILDKYRSCIGCTCFSESFKEVNEIINEIGILAPIEVSLFTDGEACVPWNNEEERVYLEVAKMKDSVLAVNTIGYGNYYNETFLKEVSNLSEFGKFTHSNNIDDYLKIFENNYETIKNTGVGSAKIETKSNAQFLYLTRKFTKLSNGKEFIVSRLDKEKNQFFIITKENEINFSFDTIDYSSKDIKKEIPNATLVNFLYAMVYNSYYNDDRELSIDILGKNIYDKALIDSHINSFNKDERAMHINMLSEALFTPKSRYINGKVDEKYVPADNATCVLDVLKELEITNSFYVPYSKNLPGYERITRQVTDTFNLFKKNPEEVLGSFEDLVYNKDFINISLRIYEKGIVTLNPAVAKNVGLPETIESGRYRNYTIIKDGNIHQKMIEVLTPKMFFDENLAYQVITDTEAINGEVYTRYIIDLTSFPIINKTYIDSALTADAIYEKVVKNQMLLCKQKWVKEAIDFAKDSKASLKKTAEFKNYTVDQIKVLEEHGLDKNLNYNGINNVMASAEEADSYKVRSMEFELKGFSKIPSTTEVIEKVQKYTADEAAGKKVKPLTVSIAMMEELHKELLEEVKTAGFDIDKPNKKCLLFLEGMLKSIKREIAETRVSINIIKMAKILTGSWFRDLKKDDEGNYFYEKKYYMKAKTEYKTQYC